MACVKPVTVQVEWGLFNLGGKPRKIPMNKAFMCADCYQKLDKVCLKFVESGKMFWNTKRVDL